MSNGISRRARTIIVLIIVGLALAGLGSISSHSGRSAGTTNTASPTGAIDPPSGPTGTVDPPSAPVTTTPASGGLNQNDWNQICAGGGCNPNDGMPTFDNGGGLSLGDDN